MISYTYRVGLDHIGIPSISAYANIIITKISFSTSTVDVAVFGRADKESHILSHSQQESRWKSKEKVHVKTTSTDVSFAYRTHQEIRKNNNKKGVFSSKLKKGKEDGKDQVHLIEIFNLICRIGYYRRLCVTYDSTLNSKLKAL